MTVNAAKFLSFFYHTRKDLEANSAYTLQYFQSIDNMWIEKSVFTKVQRIGIKTVPHR